MRKTFFGAIAVVAIAGAIALNVNLNIQTEGASQLTLSNIEALAQTEGRTDCEGPKWDGICLFQNSIHCISESYGCL